MSIKKMLTSLFILASTDAAAQIEKIDTDRPDQTESVSTIPKKWLQFESGFSKGTDKYYSPYKDHFFEHPSLLTKYGISNRVELRLITAWSTIKEQASNGTSVNTGISTVQLGGKLNFLREKGLRPKTSLIAHYDFGSLRTLYKDSIDGANFRFTMQHSLSGKFSLGYNLGMEWERFGSPPAYVYTVTVGYSFGKTEDWYAYIEGFGSAWKDEKPQHSFDGGIAYNITGNLKVDVSAGHAISKEAPDYYLAAGVSFRFKASE